MYVFVHVSNWGQDNGLVPVSYSRASLISTSFQSPYLLM